LPNENAMEEFQARFSGVMDRVVGESGEIGNLLRLSGGANMESWSFDWAGQGYVLRRAPSAAFMEARGFGHDVEAALVRAAFAAGVRAPEVVGELVEADGLGSGYVMKRVEAEVNPANILAAPPPSLIRDIARELAHIHAIRPTDAIAIPHMDTAAALAELKARFATYGGDRPIIALAIRWCEDHLPQPVEPRLVHGDFRMGNLMVDANGLAAVLDWELAHWGDPHEDLAYGCMAVWRFGQINKPAFGVADLDSYFAAYEAVNGHTVDRVRFRFWLVYRTLWWALGCLQMAEIWRSGIDRSLERPVIGRRTSENELDLLMLLEADAPEVEQGAISLDEAHLVRRAGEPSPIEMLEALREWIERDVKAKAEGRDRFMAAVGMNAIGMLIREQENPVEPHDKPLSDDILAGQTSLATPGLLGRLRKLALMKLANDSPKYASLAEARRLWLDPETNGMDHQTR
jgi:aminoglycoside phosphotransferase (APT) family kinase protein